MAVSEVARRARLAATPRAAVMWMEHAQSVRSEGGTALAVVASGRFLRSQNCFKVSYHPEATSARQREVCKTMYIKFR